MVARSVATAPRVLITVVGSLMRLASLEWAVNERAVAGYGSGSATNSRLKRRGLR
jgi:hypothetical protein